MTETPKARLILPDDVTRDEFRSIARAHGWVQHKVYSQPTETYEEVWATPSQSAALHYVEDAQIAHERFLLVRSNNLHRYVPDIARAFRTIPIEDICKTILDESQNVGQQTRALTRLGLVAFDLTPDVVEAWQAGLFHPEEQVRVAAVRAMSFIASPDFVPILDEIASADSSDKVRHEAAFLAASIRRHASPASV